MWCKHLDVSDYNLQRCAAFPDGIPEEIRYLGTVLHTEPYEGDHGIQFEKQVDDTKMSEWFQHILDHMSNYDSDTLFRMSMDMTRERENWRYDPEKYPMKSDTKPKE
jgi:hypothetical protein